MKKIILGIAVVLLAWSVNAKEKGIKSASDNENTAAVVLSGTITDSGTGELLAGVEVTLEGTELKTYTDFDGNFTFRVKPGEYKVAASYISYQKTSETVNTGTNENEVDIKLQASK